MSQDKADAARTVPGDGVGASNQALPGQLAAQPDDQLDGGDWDRCWLAVRRQRG
jgi:hypothetical protein